MASGDRRFLEVEFSAFVETGEWGFALQLSPVVWRLKLALERIAVEFTERLIQRRVRGESNSPALSVCLCCCVEVLHSSWIIRNKFKLQQVQV